MTVGIILVFDVLASMLLGSVMASSHDPKAMYVRERIWLLLFLVFALSAIALQGAKR